MGQIARAMADGLRNLVSGLGGSNDKAQAATYMLKIPTQQEIDACYRGTWLGRKIHDIPALDMTREWRSWQAEDDQIEAIELAEKNLQFRIRTRRAITLARLYGGSALIMGLPGDPKSPAPEKIGKGQLRYLHLVHRHQLSLGDRVRDLSDPLFGQPNLIRLTSGVDGQSDGVEIHPSRIVPFVGNPIPDGAVSAHGEDYYWGDPVLMAVFDALTAHDTGAAAIANLLNEAKTDIVHVPGFMDSITSSEYESRLIERFSLAALMKSITNVLVLDGGDGTENSGERWEQRTVDWKGLPEVQQVLFQIVSGAADIPATRLIQQSPTGMNATGASDTRNYYDMLASLQNSDLTPTMATLDEMLIQHATGARDPQIFYEWNPLWQMTPSEKAERDHKVSQTASAYATMGVVPDDAFAVAVQNRLIEDGVFPGLEAAIDEASKVARLEQEEPAPGEVDPVTGEPVPGSTGQIAPANTNDPATGTKPRRPAVGRGRGSATMTMTGNSRRRAANDRARASVRDNASMGELLLTNVLADFNPNHVESGINGGEFTSASAVGRAHRAAEDELRAKGKADGNEHLILIDAKTGEWLGEADGTRFSIAIPGDQLRALAADGRSVDLIHNHPINVGLSAPDVDALRMPGVNSVVAVTPDGSTYSVTRSAAGDQGIRDLFGARGGDSPSPDPKGAHYKLQHAALRKLRIAVAHGNVTLDEVDRVYYHALWTEADRAGLISYRGKLRGATKRTWDKHPELWQRITEAATTAMAREGDL